VNVPDVPGRALDPDDRRAASLQRLLASRERLRSALGPQRPRKGSNDTSATGGVLNRVRAWWQMLSGDSGAAVFSTAAKLLEDWWARQPLRNSAEQLGQAVLGEVEPWVRRRPVAAVVLAMCAGAAVAAVRPWRWGLVQSQSQRASRTFKRWAVSQLLRAPVQMAIAGALTTWLSQRQQPDDRAPGPDVPMQEAERGAAAPSNTPAPVDRRYHT
jgi:hypothetical protein